MLYIQTMGILPFEQYLRIGQPTTHHSPVSSSSSLYIKEVGKKANLDNFSAHINFYYYIPNIL